MNGLRLYRDDDPWRAFRRRATEGIAVWLSRLLGGIAAHLADGAQSSIDARIAADRLRAFVRERVTSNPTGRVPLAPVQIHLLEAMLEAVDWPALAVASELLAEDGAGPRLAASYRGGPS